MKHVLIRLLAVFLLSAATAGAQLANTETQVQFACASAMATPLPPDIAAAVVPQSYPTCNSYDLYDSKDFVAARACAIQERASLIARGPGSAFSLEGGHQDSNDLAGGAVVLAELYANGEGVQRDDALAARFVCEGVDSGEIQLANPPPNSPDYADKAEDTKKMLATLNRLKVLGPGSPHFNFCAVIGQHDEEMPDTLDCDVLATEKEAEEHMAAFEDQDNAAKQDVDDADAAIKPVLAKLAPAQRTAYNRLAAADKHFIDVQVTGGLVYMGPYGSAGPYPDEMHADFENRVVELASKGPPAPSADEFARADDTLNTVYNHLIDAATPGGNAMGVELNAGNLRTEQRAWLAYRDAFVAFGKTLAPGLPATAWMLPLTIARSGDLTQVYDGAGQDLIRSAREQRQQLNASQSHEQDQIAQDRAKVSGYFNHQTPAQAAAWKRVETAAAEFGVAHKEAAPGDLQNHEYLQLDALYQELYVYQYNFEHGFDRAKPVDSSKEAAAYAALDKKLNDAYQADLRSDCLFDDKIRGYSSPQALRTEEKAWLKLRDAWFDFLGTLFPNMSTGERANMFVGSRVFELETRAKGCIRNNQPGS